MSSSQYLASLLVPSIRQTFYFAAVQMPGGWPEEDEVLAEEELRSDGVDDVRYREVSWDWPEWQMTTMADAASWDAGMALRQGYVDAVRALSSLSWTARSVAYLFRNCKILSVAPALKAGVMTGFGATTGSSAILTATWTMKFMDTPR